jgi:DNA polymerase III epsilon subunit-like protein
VRHLIFDTETTGLPRNVATPLIRQPKIIEYFGLILEGDGDQVEEVETYHALIHPGGLISAEITEITSITNADLEGQAPFGAHIDRIEALTASADVIVAHNLKFDTKLLSFDFRRLGREFSYKKGCCTVEATEHIHGHRMKMGDLYEFLFGERFEGAHRAEADVRALARVYKELLKRKLV